MSLLHPGDTFPELMLTVPGGTTVSEAIGRLVPDDVAGLVRYAREHAATSA